MVQNIKKHGVEAGVVINPGTPVHALDAIIEEVDFVLVMSVNPGFGGQAFLPAAVDKIKQLDDIRKIANLTLKLKSTVVLMIKQRNKSLKQVQIG